MFEKSPEPRPDIIWVNNSDGEPLHILVCGHIDNRAFARTLLYDDAAWKYLMAGTGFANGHQVFNHILATTQRIHMRILAGEELEERDDGTAWLYYEECTADHPDAFPVTTLAFEPN